MTNTTPKEFFQSKVLGSCVKVELDDQRIIYGILHCVDAKKNLVLMDAIKQVPSQYIAPISKSLSLFIRYKIHAEKFLSLPQETLDNAELMKELDEEFAKDKFIVGQVIVPGARVKKLGIQKKLSI